MIAFKLHKYQTNQQIDKKIKNIVSGLVTLIGAPIIKFVIYNQCTISYNSTICIDIIQNDLRVNSLCYPFS